MNLPQRPRNIRYLILLATAALFVGALLELYNIAWGTGNWYGEFSLKWGLAFAAACALFGGLFLVLTRRILRVPSGGRAPVRGRVPAWVIGIFGMAAVLGPILLLQYTPWGIVFDGPFLRLVLWGGSVLVLALLIARFFLDAGGTVSAVAAVIGAGSAVLVAAALTEVTDYPFSLGWSEGNRLWDYSLLFGRRLYQFDAGQAPVAYLDFGRQLIGGLPFALPRVSIFGARLWLGLVAVLPALGVGLLAFMPQRGARAPGWILASLAGFAFLSQGPIHAPLLICAILVAAAWRVRIPWAVPLMLVAGYFAESSRFTWMFAPAVWAVMLELGTGSAADGRSTSTTWQRAMILGTAGLIGSAAAFFGLFSWGAASTGSSASVSTSQALLWYRLLPNATYGEGVLLGLVKAAGPLVIAVALASERYWRPKTLQRLTVWLALAAFLVVGLVVSTKIGGGGDLHNLDMFLIGLVFVAGIIWQAAGERLRTDIQKAPLWLAATLVAMLAIPYYGPLRSLRPLEFAEEASWIATLTDVERARDLGSLPGDEATYSSLEQIRASVQAAQASGEVLLMDQRQLLTFGFLRDLRLVSEYEKKRMMDEALSGNAAYFAEFYEDLAAKRFSLIISSPLRTPIKDREYGFGEENNAWVEWIARPVLCYYAEQDTLNEVKVELLVPKEGSVDCTKALPPTQE